MFNTAPMCPEDRRFVGQNLLRGRIGLPVNKYVPGDVCARWEYGAVCRAIKDLRVDVLTAGDQVAPVGFRVWAELEGLRILHWVHVEPLWRRQGAGSGLAVGYQAYSSRNAPGARLGALAGAYVPYLWTYPDKAWELCSSSRYHQRQFLSWAEELSTL